MSQNQVLSIEPPRFENLGPLVIVGFEELFTAETREQIPALWQRLAAVTGKIPGQIDRTAYGVINNSHDARGFRYLAGVEIPAEAPVPEGYQVVHLEAGHYAVFTHRQHVSKLFTTMCAIYRDWLPLSKIAPADAACFERYGADFDPASGLGTIEIWLPVDIDENE